LEITFEEKNQYGIIKDFLNYVKIEQVKNESVLISKILDNCEKEIEKITGISLE